MLFRIYGYIKIRGARFNIIIFDNEAYIIPSSGLYKLNLYRDRNKIELGIFKIGDKDIPREAIFLNNSFKILYYYRTNYLE